MNGWMNTADEFYERARNNLSYLFDCTDYGVAEALIGTEASM